MKRLAWTPLKEKEKKEKNIKHSKKYHSNFFIKLEHKNTVLSLYFWQEYLFYCKFQRNETSEINFVLLSSKHGPYFWSF